MWRPCDLKTPQRVHRAIVFLMGLVSAAAVYGDSRAGQSGGIVVSDSLSRNITLPSSATRVLSLQPEITRIIVALGAGDRLVGIDYFMREHDHLFAIIFPRGRALPAVSNTPEDMNYEMVIRLAPDVIFVSPTELQMVDGLQGKIGKPVVALASMGSFTGLMEEIRVVGRILGRTERSAELTEDFLSRTAAVRARASLIPMEKRPRVYLTFWGSLARTPVNYEPVDAAGGRNCAAGLLPAYLGTIATVVQVEQIVAWQPDIILVQGNYPPRDRALTVPGILDDARLGSVPAVKNRAVFYTFGFWYWWDPAEVLVETMYLAHILHPETAGTFDLEREGNAVFKKYYGIDSGFSSLCRILECGNWNAR
jgi:iron complex transport system substrate-binding protein